MSQIQNIAVRLLPALIESESMTGSTAVVIDVLRATTTICTALHNGAASVIACQEIDDASRLRTGGLADICGGERGGVKIEGFDFGNSPADYDREIVAGRTIAFTTTNGTRAMKACAPAKTILIASFGNLSAIVDRLADEHRIEIVCAGTDGEVTAEDTLLAGAIVEALAKRANQQTKVIELQDQANIARQFWTNKMNATLTDRLRDSQGGRNLIALGYDSDIAIAAQTDIFDRVPVLNPKTMSIL